MQPPLKPKGDENPVLGIDVANKQVKSPYRTALLPIRRRQEQEHLVLQGTDLQFVGLRP